jgi:hypothetical protein
MHFGQVTVEEAGQIATRNAGIILFGAMLFFYLLYRWAK